MGCKKITELWGNNASWIIDESEHPHEANYLKLDCTKAFKRLNWKPKWNLDQALLKIVEWHKAEQTNGKYKELCVHQINEYLTEEG